MKDAIIALMLLTVFVLSHFFLEDVNYLFWIVIFIAFNTSVLVEINENLK